MNYRKLKRKNYIRSRLEFDQVRYLIYILHKEATIRAANDRRVIERGNGRRVDQNSKDGNT